jgi:hypothetical protein
MGDAGHRHMEGNIMEHTLLMHAHSPSFDTVTHQSVGENLGSINGVVGGGRQFLFISPNGW